MQLDFLTELAFRADAVAVADNEHPDHEHRIDRGPADRGIVGRQLGVDPRQIKYGVDYAHRMISGNSIIEVELVEQLALIALQPPHHCKPLPQCGATTESLFADDSNGLLQQNRPQPALSICTR